MAAFGRITEQLLLSMLVMTYIVAASKCPFNTNLNCDCEEQTNEIHIKCECGTEGNITQTLINATSSVLNQTVTINTLNMTKCNITSLPDNFFDGINSVKDVDLSFNNLEELPYCLHAIINISTIDMSHNQIKYLNISEVQAQNLDVSYNEIQMLHICDIFPKQMEKLTCSHNHIREIPENLWTVAENVDISFNLISHLPRATTSSVKSVQIRGNSLQNIPGNWFVGFKDLTILDVSQNQIREFKEKTFAGLTQLIELNLSENLASNISDMMFKSNYRLKTLNLSKNKITSLRKSTFNGLEDSLERLYLNGNEITVIQNETFKDLTTVRYIDLSLNPLIKSLDNTEFPPHLSHLDLSKCGLQTINDCQFYDFIDLEDLDLYGNDLNCSCHLSWLYKTIESRSKADPKAWTCRAKTGTVQPVQKDISNCQEELQQTHHCKSNRLQTTNLDFTMFHSSDDDTMLVSWEIHPIEIVKSIEGFRVIYSTGETVLFESSNINPLKQMFIIENIEKQNVYTVCVQALWNETAILKEICQHVSKTNLQLIVGILAGTVFLIPCIVAMAYILHKDRKMMAKYTSLDTDIENIKIDDKKDAKVIVSFKSHPKESDKQYSEKLSEITSEDIVVHEYTANAGLPETKLSFKEKKGVTNASFSCECEMPHPDSTCTKADDISTDNNAITIKL